MTRDQIKTIQTLSEDLKNKVRKEDPNHKENRDVVRFSHRESPRYDRFERQRKLEKLRNANNDQPLSIGTKFGLLTLIAIHFVRA